MRHLLALPLAALLAGAGPALAVPVKVAVLPLDAPPELTHLGKSLSEALADEARKVGGLEVMGPDAVERRLGRAGALAAVRCADDPACLAEQGARLGVDRVVGGWLRRAGDDYKVGLEHVEVGSGAVLAGLERQIPIASRRLRPDVVAAAPGLLGGKADITGVLEVSANVPGATVLLDDAPVGPAPLSRALKPGKHKVQVSRAGYAAADPVWIEVPAGGVARHRQRLYEIPARERGNEGKASQPGAPR